MAHCTVSFSCANSDRVSQTILDQEDTICFASWYSFVFLISYSSSHQLSIKLQRSSVIPKAKNENCFMLV
jgi:hypothetical protein